jgi:hypothetical protein
MYVPNPPLPWTNTEGPTDPDTLARAQASSGAVPVWQADLQVRVYMLNDEGPEDEGDGEATSCQIWM